MNEIDLPTMSEAEHRLCHVHETHRYARFLTRVWLPVMVFFGCVAGLLLWHGLRSPAAPEVGLRINPDTAICASRPELAEAGWKRVPEVDRQRIAADARYRLIPAQTIFCTDGAQSFELREWWYVKERAPSRLHVIHE